MRPNGKDNRSYGEEMLLELTFLAVADAGELASAATPGQRSCLQR